MEKNPIEQEELDRLPDLVHALHNGCDIGDDDRNPPRASSREVALISHVAEAQAHLEGALA